MEITEPAVWGDRKKAALIKSFAGNCRKTDVIDIVLFLIFILAASSPLISVR
jgi:hypothetical protein